MSEAIEVYNGASFTIVTDDQNPSQSEIWATQKEMAKAFGVTTQNVIMHIKDILQSAELKEVETCKDSLQVQIEGEKQVTRKVKCYNLDMIISVGFRIKSEVGTRFRIWANKIVKQYATKGYVVNPMLMYRDPNYVYALSKAYVEEHEKNVNLLQRCTEQDKQITKQDKQIAAYQDMLLPTWHYCPEDCKTVVVKAHYRNIKTKDGKGSKPLQYLIDRDKAESQPYLFEASSPAEE